MKIATNGLTFNEFAQILLMQRDDTRTWAPPGGMLEAGELPTDGVAREVEEETGLKVMPVRLVGLYFIPSGAESILLFSFRCIQRGGSLQTSEESPQVGWFPTRPLPRRMLSFHRDRVVDGFHHQGGPVIWQTQKRSWPHRLGWFFIRQGLYRYRDWQRVRRGELPYQHPPRWQLSVLVMIRNEAGQVLWTKAAGAKRWRIPGGDGQDQEPPWQTAMRETAAVTGQKDQLADLRAVHVRSDHNQMVFTFAATGPKAMLDSPTGIQRAYFTPGEEPADAIPAQMARVATAVAAGGNTRFTNE